MTSSAKTQVGKGGSLELVALGLLIALVLVLAFPVFDARVLGASANAASPDSNSIGSAADDSLTNQISNN